MPTPPRSRPGRRALTALLAAAALTLLLYHLPFGGRLAALPLLWLATFAHELGHGLAALLAGGSFDSLRMWPDGSGVALSSVPDGAWPRALVSAGGLLGPAVLGAVLFLLGTGPRRARLTLAVLGALLLAAAALVLGNGFGLLYCALSGALLLGVAWKAKATTAQVVLLFLAVQLSLSVYSRGDYLFTDVAETSAGRMASDTAVMAEALGGTYWMWGLLVGGLSAAVLLGGLGLFLWMDRRPAPKRFQDLRLPD